MAQSSEPDDAVGEEDGVTTGDIRVTTVTGGVIQSSNATPSVSFNPFNDRLEVRAERNSMANGRTYTATVTATGSISNYATAAVIAPRDPTIARLSWTDNSVNEDGFRIYRITDGDHVKIAEIGANTTAYTDQNAVPRACYLVTAFNTAGDSSPSNLACLPN